MSRLLRVGTYNLWGADDLIRLKRQLAMLAGWELDILVLLECKWWDRNYRRLLHQAGRALRMHFYLVESNHHGCHIAIGVRDPYRVVEERHDTTAVWWTALAHVVVDTGHPRPLHVLGAHLAPSSPTIRLQAAEALQVISARPLLAMGDWNAVPATDPDPEIPPDADVEHVRRKLNRSAAEALGAAGWLDVGAVVGDPTPTVGHTPADRLAYRCDRIYTAGLPLQAITGYRVGPAQPELSDHRLVMAVLNLDTPAGA